MTTPREEIRAQLLGVVNATRGSADITDEQMMVILFEAMEDRLEVCYEAGQDSERDLMTGIARHQVKFSAWWNTDVETGWGKREDG